MIFQAPEQFAWLLLWLPAVALLIYGKRKQADVARLLQRNAQQVTVAPKSTWLSTAALPFATLCLIIALARPGWNPMQEQLSRETRDVVFVLDVSKSMLAQDRTPNRIENAKATILSCLDQLRSGQRVGLVVFAGTSSIKCPLTTDHRFFAGALEEVGPWSVTHGGTRIGDALLKTCEKILSDDMRGFQDVILITDGGNQEERYAEAITALNDLEASLIAIGLGSEQTGSRIPVQGDAGQSFMLHDGQEVWTKLETATLQELVQQSTRGLLLKAGTRAIDLADIYEQFSLHTEKRAVMVDMVERYEEGFPWFLGLALLGLLVGGWPRQATLALVLLGLGFGTSQESFADPASDLFMNASTQYRAGDYEGAMQIYHDAATTSDNRRLQRDCFYNMGNCAFKQAGLFIADEEEMDMEEEPIPDSYYYETAIRYYRAALDLDPHHARASHNLELARRKLKAEQDGEQADQSQPASDPSDQGEQEEGEGDPSESGEEGDPDEGDEYDESSEADADSGEQSRSTSNMTDMSNQDIPPPAITPEQLLQEEMMNNAQRQKGKGKKSTPVERDW